MKSKPEHLRDRTKQFAIDIVHFFRSLPRNEEARIIGRQILRSGTSVAANYRAACRARSKAEFVSKIGIVLEEADETVFWLEVLTETNVVSIAHASNLCDEANQLVSIFSASYHTAKSRR